MLVTYSNQVALSRVVRIHHGKRRRQTSCVDRATPGRIRAVGSRELPRGSEIVVQLQCAVLAGIGVLPLRQIIVLPSGNTRIEEIGLGKQVEKRLSVRVEAIRRYDVPGKWLP